MRGEVIRCGTPQFNDGYAIVAHHAYMTRTQNPRTPDLEKLKELNGIIFLGGLSFGYWLTGFVSASRRQWKKVRMHTTTIVKTEVWKMPEGPKENPPFGSLGPTTLIEAKSVY